MWSWIDRGCIEFFISLFDPNVPSKDECIKHVEHVVYKEVWSSWDSLLAFYSNEFTNNVCAVVQKVLDLVHDFLIDENC